MDKSFAAARRVGVHTAGVLRLMAAVTRDADVVRRWAEPRNLQRLLGSVTDALQCVGSAGDVEAAALVRPVLAIIENFRCRDAHALQAAREASLGARDCMIQFEPSLRDSRSPCFALTRGCNQV